VIFTLLGSCVAACLYDPAKQVGGMNHILLPGRGDVASQRDLARFGLDAMERLIHQLARNGAVRKRLVAKVFGGAHVLRQFDERSSPGFRNGRFIVDFLEGERIPVASADLGGYHARKIYFRTDTGEVLLRRVRVPEFAAVTDEEKRFRHRILGKLHHESVPARHAGDRGGAAGRRAAGEV
jgi:chemotaxis protein CheD